MGTIAIEPSSLTTGDESRIRRHRARGVALARAHVAQTATP
jgi:hypothetical protein